MFKQKQSGFTIVELLIIIVVIAVLATISIIAYTGIQIRATASKAASVVDSYTKIIELYKIDNGAYYIVNGAYACLGEATDFPADTQFNSGICYRSGASYSEGVNTGLNNALRAYSSQLPNGSLPTISNGTVRFRGVEYWSNGDWVTLWYNVKGNQPCPRGEASSHTGDSGIVFTECEVEIGDSS